MKLTALIAAIAAGSIGAVVWALIAHYANMEVGYVAWGIGLLVGYSAHTLGAEGGVWGVLCALIALGSMFGGKALAHRMVVDQVIKEEVLPETYEYTKTDSSAFKDVADESIPQFMVDYEYTDAESAEQIPAEEVEYFKENIAERLRNFAATSPTYDEWSQSDEANMIGESIRVQAPLIEGVKQSLGPIDLIFGLLGISTAFRLGSATHEEETDATASEPIAPPVPSPGQSASSEDAGQPHDPPTDR